MEVGATGRDVTTSFSADELNIREFNDFGAEIYGSRTQIILDNDTMSLTSTQK